MTNRFTIITVCYNAEAMITDTVKSVLSQTYADFDYIIKDGNSSDKTMDIVHSLTDGDDRVSIMRGKDRGIFDAMNLAVASAAGEYILFLNAGDRFVDVDVLWKVDEYIATNHNADILYGNVVEVTGEKSHLRVYTEKNGRIWYYSIGACLCHQGMFCKRELFQKKLFDSDYKVCADREWQMYFISRGVVTKALNITISEVMEDGFSRDHLQELEAETERCIKNYCGRWYLVYQIITGLKKNRILHKAIQKAEQIISCK